MKKIFIALLTLVALMSLAVTASFAEEEPVMVLKTDVVPLREEWQTPDEECISEVIIFEILDDTNARLTDRMIESDSMYNDTVRIGTYKLADYGYEFVSPQPFTPDEAYFAVIVPDEKTPGRIEGMTYEYINYAMKTIAGTYQCADGVFGEAVLEVNEYGKAVLTAADGRVASGNLTVYQSGYDLFADIGNDQYEDYYIELNGDAFTITHFVTAIYSPYAGTFTAMGDLGDITFAVTDDGSIEADAVLDGKQTHMSGNITVDEENQVLCGCWLYAEDGSDLNLGFETLPDGTINYYGTYSRPLAAG